MVRRVRGRRARRSDGQASRPAAYQPGKRAMLKIKHPRTADCVVAGFRWYKSGAGRCRLAAARPLRRRGRAAPRRASRRRSRGKRRRSSRRSSGRCARARATSHPWSEWADGTRTERPAADARRDEPLEPRQGPRRGSRSAWSVVAEVSYDHLQGTRFRHGTTFKRWRPDKPPGCRYDQLETTPPFELQAIFGS